MANDVCQIGSSLLAPPPIFPLGFLYGSKKGIQTEANSHKIQCEHHLVAVLFVCGKSVLAWGAGCGASKTLRRRAAPYKVMGELFVLSCYAQTKQLFFVKVLLVLFFQEKDRKTLMLQSRMPRGERLRCERARRQETRRARAWRPAEAPRICRCLPPWKMPQNSSWQNSETAPP